MKKKLIVIVGLIILLTPFSINALTGSVNLNCETNTLSVNSSTTCTLSGNSNEEISSLSARLTSNGNISISDISTSDIWQGNGLGGSIELYTDNNKIGNFEIVKFTIKTSSQPGTGTINVNSINFYDAMFNEHSISQKNLTITIKSEEKPKEESKEEENKQETNNTPSISKPENNNTVNTNKPENNNTTNSNNQENNNTVETDIKKSNDATLKSIILSDGNINFSSNVFDYEFKVSNKVEKITIKVETNNSKAKVSIPQNLNLKVGINNFEIKVTAEDGTQKIYKLHVNRLERELSKNSNLKSLEIAGYELSFSNDNYIYDLKEIKNSSLDIKAIADDENATIKIYGNNSIGKNDSIIIQVIAEDGTTSEYIIYANNIKKSTKGISIIIILVLFIISLGLNIFSVIKKIKSNNQTLCKKNK